jgi:hypothetical protein
LDGVGETVGGIREDVAFRREDLGDPEFGRITLANPDAVPEC